jgi:hypothetical protein
MLPLYYVLRTTHITNHISFRRLFEKMNGIIQLKKLIIFIDEFDVIPSGELENLLTSLRKLYIKYKDIKQKALYSVGLVGIRNITKLIVGGVSPFSLKNIMDIFAQYAEETNQPVTPETIKKILEETGRQPWLVNRPGTILTVNIKLNMVEPMETNDLEKAIQTLPTERNNHFDNLYEKS